MTAFQRAQLLHIECQMQALVSDRVAMAVANTIRLDQGLSPAYGEEAFQKNADAIRALAPDPQEFAS